MTISLDTLLDAAHRMANAASSVTLLHFRTNTAADDKGGGQFDPVTAADRGAEAVIREIITREFPAHGIIGEEYGSVNEDADYVWTLDPIDGTRAFILGLPTWGTLIGLQYKGQPLIGIMDQPFVGERFWNDARAAWYRGPGGLRRCETRRCASVESALLTATTPDMFKGEDEVRFNRLAQAVRMRRFGGDCYSYCMLALGHVDIVAEASLKTFDIAPLIPIIEKAGGAVANWDGGPAHEGGQCIACGDPSLLPSALAVLKG